MKSSDWLKREPKNEQQDEKKVVSEECSTHVRNEKHAVTGRVARILAHEVRNPLTNINLSIEQLRSEMGDQETAALFLDMIQRNSNRINQIVTDLLNATRIGEINQKSVDLNVLVDTALQQHDSELQAKEIGVEKYFAAHPLLVSADAEKMGQAFAHIITNAREAMDQGGILRVRTTQNKQVVEVWFQDNGKGILKKDAERLFEPYFSTHRKGGGLGLPMCNTIVLAHGGNIDIVSEPGKGTNVRIIMPLHS